MLVVQKFGGSSVANSERIANVAVIIENTYKAGNKVVVVLSAQGDTTDNLLEKVSELSSEPSKREVDRLLATGEQQSVALMAIKLLAMGLPAVSLGALQSGIHTTMDYGAAKIVGIDTRRIRKELSENNIVLVTGFQGVNEEGYITTLGRGGSDTTAVALAAALSADLCEIYTDVDGVYTADPRIVDSARKLEQISFDEMLAVAASGAQVLHDRSVGLGMKYGLNMTVRSSMTDGEGTRLFKAEETMEDSFMSAVSIDRDVFVIYVTLPLSGKALFTKLFEAVAKEGINIGLINRFDGAEHSLAVFTVPKGEGKRACEAAESIGNVLEIKTDDTMSKLSVTGLGIASTPGVAADLFGAILEAGGDIGLVSASETKITVLVKTKDIENAARAVHDKFKLGERL